ncbi:TPA: RAMP superfamily CRISPR-associated protein [Bacillus paranthracis]
MKHAKTWAKLHSEVIVDLTIEPNTPILIQQSEDDNEINFVSYNNQHYIPGSSLKGVLRNHTENIFYHLLKEKEVVENLSVYDKLSVVDQLFGHETFKGKLVISDALFIGKPTIEERQHIAIDRFRGGAKDGALFSTKAITQGTCKAKVILKNPETWQIAWLCYCIRDLQDGRVRVGAKSANGFGQVNIKEEDISLYIYDQQLEQSWNRWLVQENSKNERKSKFDPFQFSLDDLGSMLVMEWGKFLTPARQGVNQ